MKLNHFYREFRAPFPTIWLALLLLLAGGVGLVVPAPRPAAAAEGAKVDITLQAIPSIRVARGTILAYKLRIENYGDGTMAAARVRLPYDRSKLTIVDTLFEDEGDFVSKIDDEITISLDSLNGKSIRFAVVYMRVADYLPDNTVIDMWAGYDWEDNRGNYGISERSNAAPVLVGGWNETSDFVWMTLEPRQASAGTLFRFFSDRFLPGEEVETIIRGPDGSERTLSQRQTVAPDGRVHIHMQSGGMAPGTYNVILHGERSELKAADTFTILAP